MISCMALCNKKGLLCLRGGMVSGPAIRKVSQNGTPLLGTLLFTFTPPTTRRSRCPRRPWPEFGFTTL